MKNNIVIVAHKFLTQPDDELVVYLNDQKYTTVLHIMHSFSDAPDRCSYYRLYKNGQLVEEYKGKNYKNLLEPLLYVKELLATIKYIYKSKVVFDTYIGMDGLCVLFGRLLKLFGKVKRVIFWTMDFVPENRFKGGWKNKIYHWINTSGYRGADEMWDLSPRMLEAREKFLGIAGNRNKLKKLAKGEYIMWQDADDISMPNRMEKQVEVLDSDEEIGIVGGYIYQFNESGYISIRKYSDKDSELRANIFRYSPCAQPASMIRKQVLDEVGDYDLNYPLAEDLDMSFRIGKSYKFANIQDIVLKYRENNTGATFTRLKTMELATISIRLRYANSKEYNMRLSDHIYNILQYISIFIIPPKLKIAIFNLIRNTK